MLTLAAAVVGAVLGLLAPMTSDAVGRRSRRRQDQRDVASAIMDIFAGGGTLVDLLGGRESPPRRRLFLLALRLERLPARMACLEVIDLAGADAWDDDAVQYAWNLMMDQIGAIFRSPR